MNRSPDWLHQAQADFDQALLSARAGHHEWARLGLHPAGERGERSGPAADRCRHHRAPARAAAELLEPQSRFSRELERDAVWVWGRRVKGAAAGAV